MTPEEAKQKLRELSNNCFDLVYQQEVLEGYPKTNNAFMLRETAERIAELDREITETIAVLNAIPIRNMRDTLRAVYVYDKTGAAVAREQYVSPKTVYAKLNRGYIKFAETYNRLVEEGRIVSRNPDPD